MAFPVKALKALAGAAGDELTGLPSELLGICDGKIDPPIDAPVDTKSIKSHMIRDLSSF